MLRVSNYTNTPLHVQNVRGAKIHREKFNLQYLHVLHTHCEVNTSLKKNEFRSDFDV